ncbi:DNA replication complex GINS protein PSF3-like isoform X2 [Vespa mandarinia]|uniref:DNA replication complex GINS protein PSF3-like isoform X2 n=1 Tax=Vespa mandarinia TaxID=7446 RepID=UPI00160A4748|nr:DNA replication complex GINS protein PSF3-like isoform X2 [Vespa mandarinia]
MSLCCSYVPDYFSINDILATEERILCTIDVTLPGLGFLDISNDSDDLKQGTKLEFPVWLTHPLNIIQGSLINIELPKVYKDSYREILQADACAVSLSKWNPHFYEVGMYLRTFNIRESEKLTENLLETFKCRFRLIMDWAQNPISDLTLGSQLPRLEKDLFLISRKAKVQLNEWLKKDRE